MADYKIYKNNKGRWCVKHESGKKDMRDFPERSQALDFALSLAKRCRAKISVAA